MDPHLMMDLHRWEEQCKKRDQCFDHSRKIYLPNIHPHELVFNNGLHNNTCNVCKKIGLREAYRCREKGCDFDCCLECQRS